jgi:hypothetical protein
VAEGLADLFSFEEADSAILWPFGELMRQSTRMETGPFLFGWFQNFGCVLWRDLDMF